MVLKRVTKGYRVIFSLCDESFYKDFVTKKMAVAFIDKFERNYVQEIKSLEDCVILYLKNVSGLKSTKSCRSDVKYLRMLCKFIGEGKYISQIKQADLEEFRNELLKSISASSVNRYFSTIKHFFRKCDEWGYLSRNPCRNLRRLSEAPVVRNTWLERDIRLVRMYLKRHHLSDFYVFEFLRLTGCRLSSITELKVKDIDLINKTASLVTRKGPRARERCYIIPLHSELVIILRLLIANKKPNDFVFLTNRGCKFYPNRFCKRFRKVLQRAEVECKSSLHGLRHLFATNLSKNGVPLKDISRLLGHANTVVTERYLHVSVEDLRKHIG